MDPKMQHILLVDSNTDTRREIRQRLSSMNIEVLQAASEAEARELFKSYTIDLALIELQRGSSAGFELCHWVRAVSNVPILALIERGQEVNEEIWLAAGADDFVSKPIGPRTLTLRVMQQLGRNHAPMPQEAEPEILTWGPLSMNTTRYEFFCNRQPIALTNTEYQIMHLLMQHPDQVFSRDQILNSIGMLTGVGSDHIVNVHASRIRAKIRAAGGPEVIKVVRSVGFRLGDREPAHA
jgi:two-component system response regulator ResD